MMMTIIVTMSGMIEVPVVLAVSSMLVTPPHLRELLVFVKNIEMFSAQGRPINQKQKRENPKSKLSKPWRPTLEIEQTFR